MVVVGTGTCGSAVVSNNYPVTDGLIAGTTKQEGTKEHLEPEINLTLEGWGSL